jgi:Ca-activated chloride channel family protein
MDMTFLHPEFIYLMLPLVLVLFYFLLTQKEPQAAFFSDEVLAKLRVQSNTLTLRARNGLFLLMFIMMILALAQPVIEEGKVKVQAKSADIMVALDISDSMLCEDLYPSRIEAAKKKILTLLGLSKQERFGVMAFANDAYLVSPLSFDHRAVRFLLKQMKPAHMTEKGTDFMQLLKAASQLLGENKKKYLLILSDGGDQESFEAEAAYAKEQGIKVFVLGIGTEKGGPIKKSGGGFVQYDDETVITKLNHAVADLAKKTGGAYIASVVSDRDIRAMMSEITEKTDRRSLEEEEITRYIPLFIYPVGAALLLLLVATSSMSRRKRVEIPALFAGAVILLQAQPSDASLLDFRLLDDARAAYVSGDYNRSSELYADYAHRHRTNEAYYNQANALYKTGKYANAAKLYRKIHTVDEELQRHALHNLGNAYAKQGSEEMLKNSVKSYEKSLEIKEDSQTRENLEMVKKRLQEMKKQQQPKNDQKKQNGEQKKDEKGDSGQNKQNKAAQDSKEQGAQQPSQRNGREEQTKKSEKAQSPGEDNATAKPEQEQQREAKKEDANVTQSKSEKQKNAQDEEAEVGEEAAQNGEIMSDLEARKWLQKLNDYPRSHIYRITPKSEEEKRNEDAKPW